MDCVPIFSQIKWAVQKMQGDLEGAEKTLRNVAKGLIVATETYAGGKGRSGTADLHLVPGMDVIDEFRKGRDQFVEGLADSIPSVGRIKGGVHYALGDKKKGYACMIAATKCAAVLAAGVITSGAGS
jgi:hypothetical protein